MAAQGPQAHQAPQSSDVLIIGAGVFGLWAAYHLHQAGRRVAVIEAFEPAHGNASSGGESRVTRCGYGDQDRYTEWAGRAMYEWRALAGRANLPLFNETGVLWIHPDGDPLVEANVKTLTNHNIPFQQLTPHQLRGRYPVLMVTDHEAGFFEPHGGCLMARQAVRYLARELQAGGVRFLPGEVAPIRAAAGDHGLLQSVTTTAGEPIAADQFICACGPWLDRVCPDAMTSRLFVTRQEVVYFDVEGSASGDLPVWLDLPCYGMPNVTGRGFKVANDHHGPLVDIDTMDRAGSPEAGQQASEFLARRFPALAGSPVKEIEVCQYENSSNGDFVLDRHPGLDNVWLAGCGSGHGFKHGPAVGAHLAGLVLGKEQTIARFSLASKQTRQQRAIQ